MNKNKNKNSKEKQGQWKQAEKMEMTLRYCHHYSTKQGSSDRKRQKGQEDDDYGLPWGRIRWTEKKKRGRDDRERERGGG